MAPRQMAARCPGARIAEWARLDGWRFHITTRGTANIVADRKGRVYGVLWRCEPRHLILLDRWEGVAWRNYRRHLVRVQRRSGDHCSAICYISSRTYAGRARADYLLGAVIPGARAHALPSCFLQELESWRPRRPLASRDGRYSGRYSGKRS